VTIRMVRAGKPAGYLSRLRKASTILLFLASILAVACHRDPNVQKQKFLQQGIQAFDKGDYSAASIYFSRAIQVDPRFVDAHFRSPAISLNYSPISELQIYSIKGDTIR